MSSVGVFAGAGMGTDKTPIWPGHPESHRGIRPDSQSAWQQVLSRDGNARFLYGVQSTGIFCRPSCPSRRPSEHNVVYFKHAGAAIAAGFRACLRCRPAGVPAEAAAVATICAHLKANFDRKVTLSELAAILELSPFTVQRMVKRVLGVSALEYQRGLRAAALRHGLADAATPITDVIYDAGYSSSSRAYENSNQRLGMKPANYRARGMGQHIRFATAKCPLGHLLVAATGRGICSITLGDSPEALEAELRAQFPKAEVLACVGPDPGPLETLLQQVLSQMTEHPAAVDLPVDVRATAFQTRVWQALRAIPRGETRSYTDIARELGHPNAVRAVARACASNPLALVIPCHRVVGGDGKLKGYRWGVERKRQMLQIERASGSFTGA